MYKTMVIGNLGHNNKYFDRTCRNCGKIYDGMTTNICEKCGIQLVPITNGNGRAMAISEGTIYPSISNDMKETQKKVTESTPNGMPIVHRFALFSFAGEDGIVPEHPLHMYLTKGRQVQLEVNHEPVAKHYMNGDDKMCCELRYAIITSRPYNDKVSLLGHKTEERNTRGSQHPASQPSVQTELEVLKARLAVLEAGNSNQTPAVEEEPEIPSETAQCEFFDEHGNSLI